MTTTVDKINRLFMQMCQEFDSIQEELQSLKEDKGEPPDPEPLECWATTENGRLTGECWPDSETVPLSHRRQKHHMREVTPQMEQDEKDARRYRWWKHHYPVPGSDFGDPSDWDDRADEAMEEK